MADLLDFADIVGPGGKGLDQEDESIDEEDDVAGEDEDDSEGQDFEEEEGEEDEEDRSSNEDDGDGAGSEAIELGDDLQAS